MVWSSYLCIQAANVILNDTVFRLLFEALSIKNWVLKEKMLNQTVEHFRY